jgi:hypothetical protein
MGFNDNCHRVEKVCVLELLAVSCLAISTFIKQHSGGILCMKAGTSYENDTLLAAVHSLIKLFVERQLIVLEAIRDLRPDWIIRAEGRIKNEFSYDEWLKLVQKYNQNPYIGLWGINNEWEYYLHGMGCRLKHTTTREPLEWDLGNLHVFDKNWFFNYVQWLIVHAKDKDTLFIEVKLADEDETLKELLSQDLNQLTEAGIAKPNTWGNKYLLISE